MFNRNRSASHQPSGHQLAEQALDDAVVLLNKGDFQGAHESLGVAIEYGNTSTKFAAYYDRAVLYQVHGLEQEHQQDVQDYMNLRLALASQQQTQRHPDDTTNLPLSAQDYPGIARIYRQRVGGWSTAAETFRREIRQNTSDPTAWVNLGYALCRTNETQDGMTAYGEAIRLDPRCDLAYGLRGDRQRRFRNYDAAQSDLNQAISIAPGKATHWYHRAILYDRMSESGEQSMAERALRDFTQAIAIEPEFAMAHIDRAYLWEAVGQPMFALYDHHCHRKVELSWFNEFPQTSGNKAAMAAIESFIRQAVGLT